MTGPDMQKFEDEYLAKKRSFKQAAGKIEKPEVMFKKGARFYKDEATGKTMFLYKLDVNNEFSAVANDSHRDAHPKEWLAFARTQKGVKK